MAPYPSRLMVAITDAPVASSRDRKSTRRTPVTSGYLVCRLLLEKKRITGIHGTPATERSHFGAGRSSSTAREDASVARNPTFFFFKNRPPTKFPPFSPPNPFPT